VLLFPPAYAHRSIPSAAAPSLEVRRFRLVSIAASVLLVVSAAACSKSSEATVEGESPAANLASSTPAAGAGGASASSSPKHFDQALFDDDSATVDNEWFPLVPGTRYVWEGHAFEDDGQRIDRRVVFTVTDLTKVVAGVRSVVGWDRDFNDDELGESELIFFAQDMNGNVWHLGEYVEHYSDGEFEGGRFWTVGDPVGAEAGLHMPAEPQVGDPSFSEGFAPKPWFWNDLARVYDMGVRTCVPVDCFDALVMEEFEPRIPGAYQLKYYAQDVGNVRVGWRGRNEEEQESMVLAEFFQLSSEALDAARDEALAMEHRATAYARMPPAEQRSEESP
jgi:hypothetical protein